MNKTAFSSRDLAMAGIVVFIWGMNFVVMKFGLREFTPFQLAAARFALAAFPLMLFVKRPAISLKLLLVYGLLQGVGQFGFLFTALKVGMTASLASVIMQTQVFFTAVMGVWLLGEKISPTQRRGMVLAAIGLSCFAMHLVATNSMNTETNGLNDTKITAAGLVAVSSVTFAGLLLNIGAAASWAAANVAARKTQQNHPDFEPLSFVVWTSAVPVLPLALMSALTDSPASHANWLNATWMGWSAVVYLALCATVFAYAMWTQLIKRHAASRVSPFGLAVPVVGLSAGTLILGELLSPWQWAGVGFVVCALAATVLGPRWTKS